MSPLNLKICFFFITKIIISCCSCTITLSPCSLLVSLLMANDESHNQLPETDTLLHGYHPNSPNRWSRGSQTITATTNLSYLSAKRLATCSITLQGQRAPDGTWILQCKGVFFIFFSKAFLNSGDWYVWLVCERFPPNVTRCKSNRTICRYLYLFVRKWAVGFRALSALCLYDQ